MASKLVIWVLLVTMINLAACIPTMPGEPDTKTPVTPQVANQATEMGKWQILSSGNEVLDLLVDGNEVWAATTGGVVRWNAEDGNYQRYTTLDGLASYQVSALIEDKQGIIWAITGNGVSSFDGADWHTYTSEDGLASYNVICAMEDSRGTLWFGTYGGVSCYSK